MSYFKLDVEGVNISIQKYKKNKLNYEEDLILLCNSLINIDSAWNDVNSQIFIQKVSSDKYKLLSYFQNVDTLFDELSSFVNALDVSLANLGYKNELKKIYFDDSQLGEIHKHLNDILSYLNDALYQVNGFSSYNDINLISTLKNQLNSSISLVEKLKDNFDKFTKTVLDNVNYYANLINKINNLDLKLDVIRYNAKIVDLL